MSALFKSQLLRLAVSGVVGLFLLCALAAQNPGRAQEAKAKKATPDSLTSLLATTDPVFGYLGTQESIFVDASNHAAAGWLLCMNYVSGQQELVLAVLTLEGPGTVSGYQGWVYKTNLDATKYSTTDVFVSDEAFWLNNQYAVFGKTATGSWTLKDYCTKTQVAGSGAGSSTFNATRSAF